MSAPNPNPPVPTHTPLLLFPFPLRFSVASACLPCLFVCFWLSVGCRNNMQKLTANNLQTAIPTCKKRCRYARFAGRFRVLQFVCNWVADGLQVKVLHLFCT